MTTPLFATVLDELRQRPTEPTLLAEPVSVSELPTPALLIDEDALERNIAKMAAFLAERGKGVRPHGKTHKCPEIARRQLAAGAVGVCAAKVSEAVVLVSGGVNAVLVTSAVVNPHKAAVVADLSRRAKIDIVVDSQLGISVLADALTQGDDLGVLVDLDVEMGRTGVRSNDVMVALAERIQATPGMTFRGVQHYAGHLMHVEGYDARRERSLGLWSQVADRIAVLEARGFPCEVVTGCGTGTFNIDCEVDVVTDLQVGSYVFMDQEYLNIGGRESPVFDDFEVSLTVATTAISQPTETAVTVDGGYKVFASDTVNPEPLDLADSRFRFAGDEHGVLLFAKGTQQPVLGSVQRFVTPHCDPTVNLHENFWIHRGEEIYARWPVSARGCSW